MKCKAPLILGKWCLRGVCSPLYLETVHDCACCWSALAWKAARRSEISAARCAMCRRLSSGVTLVSPLGLRTNGLPIAKGGLVTSLCQAARSCARVAHSVKVVDMSKSFIAVPWRVHTVRPGAGPPAERVTAALSYAHWATVYFREP